MSYSTKAFFLQRISQEDLDRLTGSNDANLTSAIASADSMIDSYLKAQVKTLPLDPVPEVITQLSFDIAIYYMNSRTDYADLPESVEKRYNAAIDYLKQIASGKSQIPGLTADEHSENTIIYSSDGNLIDRKTF